VDDLAAALLPLIREVPDFPQPGVLFRDVAPVFADATAFRAVVNGLIAQARQIDTVVGVEARGFLLGATAGRTTLNGEGLQHEDGHSLLIAATNPAVVAYDPAFAFEIAQIVENGLHRMYGENPENIY